MFTKEDIAQWQQHEVTKELRNNLKERIDEARDLLEQGSTDVNEEYRIRGIIVAFRELLDWTPNIEGEETDA